MSSIVIFVRLRGARSCSDGTASSATAASSISFCTFSGSCRSSGSTSSRPKLANCATFSAVRSFWPATAGSLASKAIMPSSHSRARAKGSIGSSSLGLAPASTIWRSANDMLSASLTCCSSLCSSKYGRRKRTVEYGITPDSNASYKRLNFLSPRATRTYSNAVACGRLSSLRSHVAVDFSPYCSASSCSSNCPTASSISARW